MSDAKADDTRAIEAHKPGGAARPEGASASCCGPECCA
jgi:hypothetical protein